MNLMPDEDRQSHRIRTSAPPVSDGLLFGILTESLIYRSVNSEINDLYNQLPAKASLS